MSYITSFYNFSFNMWYIFCIKYIYVKWIVSYTKVHISDVWDFLSTLKNHILLQLKGLTIKGHSFYRQIKLATRRYYLLHDTHYIFLIYFKLSDSNKDIIKNDQNVL